jgi:hypothetical protein
MLPCKSLLISFAGAMTFMKQFMIITAFSLLVSTEAFSKTTKEVWLNFTGSNHCEVGFCAEGVPSNILEEALKYYKKNQQVIQNDNFIAMADMSQNSTKKRFYILNLHDGSVESMHIAHGVNSETSKGHATKFSNKVNSLRTALGFYVTEVDTFDGKNGESLRLYGLSKTNDNAYERGIIIHPAHYVSEEYIKKEGMLGTSEGCPAVSYANIESVLTKLKGKALLYIYSNVPSLKWWQ